MSHTAQTSTAPVLPAVAANPPVNTGYAPAIAGASSPTASEADAAGLRGQRFDGPWSLDENDIRDDAQAVVSDRTGETVCDVFVGHRAGDCEARARLIAEAPAMLEALQKIMAHEDALSASLAGLAVIGHCRKILARIDGEA